jgi:hypothetical protein
MGKIVILFISISIKSYLLQLKNISQIEHSRHKSPSHFLINLLSGLIADQLKEKKPSISLKLDDAQLLMAV